MASAAPEFAPSEAQITAELEHEKFLTYRNGLQEVFVSIAEQMDFYLVDWLGLSYETVSLMRRDSGGQRIDDSLIQAARDAGGEAVRAGEEAGRADVRFARVSLEMYSAYGELLREKMDGAFRPSAAIPNGIAIDDIYRDAIAIQEKALEELVMQLVLARLKIILFQRMVLGASNWLLRPQYRAVAKAVDALIVPPPRDLEQYAVEKNSPLQFDNANMEPLRSVILEEAAHQLDHKAWARNARISDVAVELKQAQDTLTEQTQRLWLKLDRTLSIVLLATRNDRTQILAAFGIRLEAVWADLLTKWIIFVTTAVTLDDLETAFSVEAVDRMKRSVDLLNSYASAAPVISAQFDIAGLPKKRDYRYMLMSPAGKTVLRYYRLLLAIDGKGTSGKDLAHFASIVPYETVMADYPTPTDDQIAPSAALTTARAATRGYQIGPVYDKLDQVEIFFEQQVATVGGAGSDFAFAAAYWNLRRNKAILDTNKNRESAIRFQTAELRLKELRDKRATQ